MCVLFVNRYYRGTGGRNTEYFPSTRLPLDAAAAIGSGWELRQQSLDEVHNSLLAVVSLLGKVFFDDFQEFHFIGTLLVLLIHILSALGWVDT